MNTAICIVPVAAIRREPNYQSEITSQLLFGDQLGDTPAHDVVAIAEATGKNDEMSAFKRGRLEQGCREHSESETSGF